MKKILLCVLIALCGVSVKAVEPSKFQVALDYHYNLGFAQRGMGYTMHRSECSMYGNSLHLSLLYNINQKYTVGVGLGMDRYEPAPNTLPIFATFRYRPFVKPNLSDFYAFTNLGYAVSSKDDFDLTSGFMGDFGIGWSKMFYKHFGINLQIAYNLKQFRFPTLDYIVDDYVYYEPTLIKISQWRHSLSFGVGLVF